MHANAAFPTPVVVACRRSFQRQPLVVRASSSRESGRRAVVLHSNAALLLASLLHLGGARPSGLGVQRFGSVSTLALCPRSPECISTAEEANDAGRYVPPWTYSRSEESVKRGLEKPTISRSDAIAQLVAVVKATSPDGWEPAVVKQQGDEYLYVEYTSPVLGLVDDVEFFLPGDGRVEYRSASRTKLLPFDSDINRKRIRTLREALQKKGWRSVGF